MKFIILGNMSFKGFPQREHAFAIGLAERGYDVIFIEGMPSFGSTVKGFLSEKWKNDIVMDLPKSLHVLTPPMIPTMSKSSYTPAIDRMIFRRWMKKQFCNYNWSETIGIVTIPYWWYGFADRTTFPVKKLIYDSCDSILVPSRTLWALERMKTAEINLLHEANAVTYSAHAMGDIYSHYKSYCVTNAVSKLFFHQNNVEKGNGTDISIGYIGSLDSRWIDSDLILHIAEKLRNGKVHLYGPLSSTYQKKIKKITNIISHGFISPDKIPYIMNNIDVAIIPFLKNAITDFVNPLKLYEYSSAGIPIVATHTKELENYNDLIYLSDTQEQFIEQIQRAFIENNGEKRQQRIAFAEANTWDKKVDQLLQIIQT